MVVKHIHDHNTRGSSLLHLSQIRSSYGHKTIHFLGSLLWNALPPDVKELSKTKMFKQKLSLKSISCLSDIECFVFLVWYSIYVLVGFFFLFIFLCYFL